MFDFDEPFFRPLWVRIVVVSICVGWGLFELLTGSMGWAIMFLAAGGYVAYRLLVAFNPEDRPK